MNAHLRKDIDKLRGRLLKVAMLVEENVRKSFKALKNKSEDLVLDVINTDKDINNMEVDTEEECLKILALHQPVAGDLRFVVSVLKINNELEHIGDMAVSIANRIPSISNGPNIEPPIDVDKMLSETLNMLKNSVDSFLNGDEMLAIEVFEADELIDELNKEMYLNLEKAIKADSSVIMAYLNYLSVSRSLERIADMCSSIAEDVIYLKRSLIARHNMPEIIESIRKESNLD